MLVSQVAYFVSLGTAIGFYLFFLLTNEPFDYRPFQQKMFSRWQQSRLNKTNFDQQTFDKCALRLQFLIDVRRAQPYVGVSSSIAY